MKGRRADAMLPANLADLSPGLCLLQEGNNLALAKLRLALNTFLHHSMMAESSSYALCTSRGSLRQHLFLAADGLGSVVPIVE